MFCNYHYRIFKCILLCLISFHFTSCYTEKSQNIEFSDDSIVENHVKDEQSLKALHYKLHQLRSNKDNEQFNAVGDALFKKAKKLGNKSKEASYHRLKAYRFKETLKLLDSAFLSYNTAKNLFIEINDSISAGQCLSNMAIIQKDQNDHHGSEATAVDGLSYLKNSEENITIASLYNIIGTNRRKLLNYKDAIDDYTKAIALTPNKKNRLIYKNNLAANYNDLKQHAKAIGLLSDILEDSLLVDKNSELKARIIDNLAYSKWLQNSEASVVNEFFIALEIRDSINDVKGLFASHTHLAEYYLDKDAEKAIEYAQKVIANSRKYKRPNAELDILRIIRTVKPTDISIRERFIILSDSMEIEEKKARNLFAKAKYDTKEIKERNLKLREKNALEEQQKIINGIIAVLVLIIAVFIVYYLYQKHKREKILEVYNTETRISKKVHDELANDVYNVMVILQKVLKNKAGLTNKVLNQVEDIYVRTRNISHENDSIDTGEYYADGLREMIGDYNTDETAIIIKDIEFPHWENIETYIKIVVYRVLQELMVNMKKHSKANVVVLTFSTKDKNLIIAYSDNGIGLPFIKASKKDLLNMENRIQSAEGTLNFDPESGKGLKLRMTFPI